MSARVVLLAGLLGAALPLPAIAATGDCADRLTPETGIAHSDAVTASQLIELRDIGYPAPISSGLTLALSPDGRRLAFPMQRASLADNGYCSGMVVLDLLTGTASVVGSSPGLTMAPAAYRGPVVPDAIPAFVKAAWSPDGQWIAFLRPDRGTTSLWRIKADGTQLSAIPGTDATVDTFAWSDDGSRMIVSAHPGVAQQIGDMKQEAETGFHFDKRFLPFMTWHPYPLAAPASIVSIDIATGAMRPASPSEADRIRPLSSHEKVPAPSGLDRAAWTAPEHADRIGSPLVLHVIDHGREWTCPEESCRNVTSFWWSADGQDIAYLRKQGWDREQTGLYLWHAGDRPPHEVVATRDVLLGCIRRDRDIICGREGATEPRRIVAISLDSGRSRSLFEPNPTYPSARTQPAERLLWSTERGTPVFGDMVLPVGYQSGRHYPVIVVNYQTQGFLRGATGDEYPIQLFAQHGFVVLSVERPRDVGIDTPGIRDMHELQTLDAQGWVDRANVESAVERGVQLLVDRGIADPDKVGITGLSDAAETVSYALIHYPHLAAAAMSNCCNEPEAFLAMGGPATADDFLSLGYPKLVDHDAHYWEPASLAYNASRIRTPTLMQLPEHEFGIALQSMEALREANAPLDVYLFPDEGHVKLGPRHRLAIYRRNLAWFDFWLNGKRDTDLVPAAAYARWDAIRVGLATRATPAAPQ